MQSIGDLAYMLTQRANQTRIKGQLNQLGTELTTGLSADPAARDPGGYSTLAPLEASLSRASAFLRTNVEARLLADATQRAMADIQDVSGQLGIDLLNISTAQTQDARDSLAASAANGFDTVVTRLNARLAGRSLFAGTATDSPALPPAETLLAQVRGALTPGAPAATILAELDTWFDTPGGAFETTAYLGVSGAGQPLLLAEGEQVSLDIQADNAVFRDVLKASLMATLAVDPALGLTALDQANLIRAGAEGLIAAQAPLTTLRADLGAVQERIELVTDRNTSDVSTLSQARTTMLEVDGFETATRLEQTRTQLETFYAVTARQRGLSLVDFLR